MSEEKETNDYMLSTYDNPFNPFTEFERWWKEDLSLGHDCCGTLARTANTSDYYSDEKNQEEVYAAINYIVEQEPTIYKKVYQNS